MTSGEQISAIVIETHAFSSEDTDQRYRDTETEYEFPGHYLSHFATATESEPLGVVLYEPRLKGHGRMSYVGWTSISSLPLASPYSADRWIVRYDSSPILFDRPVPREVANEPIESWLGEFPRGRSRNIAVQGKAVRPLASEDLQSILRLAGLAELIPDARDGNTDSEERAHRVVRALIRRRHFALAVRRAYENRCAVTELSLTTGILEAAHIQPIGTRHKGPDNPANGILLAPTVHRLFDAGILGLRYEGPALQLMCSRPELEANIVSALGLLRIPAPVRLPKDHSLAPGIKFVRYHQEKIFGKSRIHP